MNFELLKKAGPKVVICEEAGEVMEPHTLCTLLPTIEHGIFIGDPEQLRYVFPCPELIRFVSDGGSAHR